MPQLNRLFEHCRSAWGLCAIAASLVIGFLPAVASAQVVINMPAPKRVTPAAATAGEVALHRYARVRTEPYETYGMDQSSSRYRPYGNYGYPLIYGFGWGWGFPIFISPVCPKPQGTSHALPCPVGSMASR